jgi:hypothetical protein
MNTLSYELILQKSIGLIHLGASKSDVRLLLGNSNVSDEGTFDRTDYYDEKELVISYDKDTDLCSNLRVDRPAELWFQGINILALNWDEDLAWIKKLDPSCELKENGFLPKCISHKFHFSMTASDTGEGFDSEGNGNYVLVVGSLTMVTPNYWDVDEEEEEAWIQKKMAELPSEEECLRELGLDASVVRSLYVKDED